MKPTKTQLDFCENNSITFDQFTGQMPIMGSLILGLVTSIPEGFSPIIECNLDLASVKVLPERFSPTVGNTLNLSSVLEISKGFAPTVGGTLNLSSVLEIPEGFNPTVGGSLNLSSVQKLPKGFSPTVWRYLLLDSIKVLPEGFSPIVGGALEAPLAEAVPKGFNPTVEWCVYMGGRSLDSSEYTKKKMNFIDFKNGFIKCDGVFMQVVSHKGNVWKGCRFGSSDDLYLVSDGNNRYAHGETLKQAKEDLIFKVDGRRPDDFEHLTAESVLSFEESIIAYRVITGACSYGVKDYIRNRLPQKQEEFRMSEVIRLTRNEYGGENFSKFIKKGLPEAS